MGTVTVYTRQGTYLRHFEWSARPRRLTDAYLNERYPDTTGLYVEHSGGAAHAYKFVANVKDGDLLHRDLLFGCFTTTSTGA